MKQPFPNAHRATGDTRRLMLEVNTLAAAVAALSGAEPAEDTEAGPEAGPALEDTQNGDDGPAEGDGDELPPPDLAPDDPLPEDTPHRNHLTNQGVETVADVVALDREALIALSGIGEERADDVLAWVDERLA